MALLPQDGIVLDCPCGTGRMTRVFSSRGLSAVGADISIEMLRNALSQPDAPPCVQADITALPFADETFPTVVSMRLMYHLWAEHERVQALSELARVSKQYVIVSFFHRFVLQGLHRDLKTCWAADPTTRLPMSRRRLEREAVAAGLVVLRYYPTLPGVSQHTLVLMEKVPDESVVCRRRRDASLLLADARRFHPVLSFVASREILFLLAMGLALTCIVRNELEFDLFNWPSGVSLVLVGVFLRQRAIGLASRGEAIGWFPSVDHLRRLAHDVVTGWMLIFAGMALMSELVFLLPPAFLFFSLGRKSLVLAVFAGPFKRLLETDPPTRPSRSPARMRYAVNVLFHATVALCVVMFCLKELFID